jgi:hypothetical protein
MTMKKIFPVYLLFLFVVCSLVSCTKEGKDGPQGPQGPPGNPGANSGSGGGGNTSGTVKAYVVSKPVEWRYFTAGGTAWLVYQDWKYDPVDCFFYIPNVDDEDLKLTYLQLASGAGTFWAPLPYSFQTGSPARTETYRILTMINDEDYFRWRVTADLLSVKVPYYKVQSMKVIVVPGESSELGERAVRSLSLEDAMKKYHLEEKDFKPLTVGP